VRVTDGIVLVRVHIIRATIARLNTVPFSHANCGQETLPGTDVAQTDTATANQMISAVRTAL